jgi:hypothetical protein
MEECAERGPKEAPPKQPIHHQLRPALGFVCKGTESRPHVVGEMPLPIWNTTRFEEKFVSPGGGMPDLGRQRDDRHVDQAGARRRNYADQPSHPSESNSACSSTVCVAFSCMSGGYATR